MIYPTDFNYNISKTDGISNGKKGSTSSFSILHIPQSRLKDKSYSTTLPALNDNESTWIRYCNNSTVHGLRYLTNSEIQFTER